MNNAKIRNLDISRLGILIALYLICSRFISINTPIVTIGFGFIPLAIIGILYGPKITGISAVISDILTSTLFPTGNFFPGFTVTALLTGIMYGFFKTKKLSITRILIIVSIVCIVFNLGLNTYWLSILTGKAYIVLLPVRIFKNIIMIPVQVIVISVVNKVLNRIK